MLGAVVLVIFAAIGVAHVAYPDRFINQYLIQKYGLPALRLWYRMVGAIFAGFAIYVLYAVFLRG